MWNWNFGNIRGSGDVGSMAIPGANEIIGGKAVVVEAGFAAYSSRLEGARAMVRLLSTKDRYSHVWAAAVAGDVETYVHELHAAGYFTANVDLYLKGVRGTVAWLEPTIDAFLATLTKAQST
jgi:flagellum-specific peptidoglycan hydrolase FlgJ